MDTIKLTTKRQATFPVELCQDMGLKPGDEIVLQARMLNGQRYWLLRPKDSKLQWIGSLNKYAAKKSHQKSAIRRGVARGIIQEKMGL